MPLDTGGESPMDPVKAAADAAAKKGVAVKVKIKAKPVSKVGSLTGGKR